MALLATAATSWLHRAAVDLEVGPLTPRGGPGPHPLLDFSSHGHERLLNIGSVLGTRLQEGDAQRVCKLLIKREEEGRESEGQRTPAHPGRPGPGPAHLGCGVIHHFLGGEITLVAHQELIDILTGIAVDLL